jgi:hypothetical protein
MTMNMTLDELVNSQIRDYLKSEDFIDKYDTQQVVTDEIENLMSDYMHSSDADDKYATTDYVDEEIRQHVRCVVDEDGYATEEYVDAAIAEHILTAIEVQDLIDGRVNVMSAAIVRDAITKLRKELHLEDLVPAEKQKTVNQLDQFVSPDGLIAGYPDWDTLTSFVGASLSDPSQKQMVIAMVLSTARNIIQEQLDNDH